MMSTLYPVLRKFTGIKGFFSKITSFLSAAPLPEDYDEEVARSRVAEILSGWTNLTKVHFNDQPLHGHLPTLLLPLPVPLVKLCLVRAVLEGDDICCIGESSHAPHLRFLQLDHNDLNTCLAAVVETLPRLAKLIVLQTRYCSLTYEDCMELVAALCPTKTLKSWALTNNYLHTMDELKSFLTACSKILTLREVGCRPSEYQYFFGRLYMHNKFHLTEDEKDALGTFAEKLQLLLI